MSEWFSQLTGLEWLFLSSLACFAATKTIASLAKSESECRPSAIKAWELPKNPPASFATDNIRLTKTPQSVTWLIA